MPYRFGADGTCNHSPRDQAIAAAVARDADRKPAGSGTRSRGDGLARRALGRSAGNGTSQGRPLRDRTGQQQSGQSDAPLLGGARSDPQSDVDDGWSVKLGGRVLPLPQRQHLAAPLPATDATGVDDGVEYRDRPDGSRARPRRWDLAFAVGRRPDVRGLSQASTGARLDGGPRP